MLGTCLFAIAQDSWGTPRFLSNKRFEFRHQPRILIKNYIFWISLSYFAYISTGLAGGEGTASFESYLYPGYYMRHYYKDLYLEHIDDNSNEGKKYGMYLFRTKQHCILLISV